MLMEYQEEKFALARLKLEILASNASTVLEFLGDCCNYQYNACISLEFILTMKQGCDDLDFYGWG